MINALFLFQAGHVETNAIIFMSQVASLLHDDVLDDAETRRGIGSLNFVMGNKVQLFLFTPQLELIIYIFFLFLCFLQFVVVDF